MSTDGSPTPPPPIQFEPNPPVAQSSPSAVPPPMPPPAPPPVEYSAPQYVAPPPPPPPPLDTVPVSQAASPGSLAPYSSRQNAIQMGYDAETVNQFDSDEAFDKGMLKALEQAGENQPYAAIGRQVAPRWDEVQQMLTVPADAQPPVPAVPEVDPWPSCARDPAYDKLPRDAQGNYLYNDITEAKDASAANADRVLRRERLDGLANDPVALIRRAGLDKYLDERDDRMRSEYRNELEARDVTSVQQAHLQKHLAEYCQADAQGNLLRDRSNNFVLTPRGEAYEYYLKQSQEWNAPRDQWHEYAVRQVEAEEARGTFGPAQPGQSPAAQAQPGQAPPIPLPNPSPAQVGQQQRESFLNEAQASLQQSPPGAPTTNRDGTFPGSDALAPLQNADASIKEMANDILAQAGQPTQ